MPGTQTEAVHWPESVDEHKKAFGSARSRSAAVSIHCHRGGGLTDLKRKELIGGDVYDPPDSVAGTCQFRATSGAVFRRTVNFHTEEVMTKLPENAGIAYVSPGC